MKLDVKKQDNACMHDCVFDV